MSHPDPLYDPTDNEPSKYQSRQFGKRAFAGFNPPDNSDNLKEQEAKTIRADATIEERIQDYFGKFHIEYNGVTPHEPFYGDDGEDSGLPPGVRCDTDVKKEIVDQLLQLFQDYAEGLVPNKKSMLYTTDIPMKKQVQLDFYADGYHKCRQDILDKIKESK